MSHVLFFLALLLVTLVYALWRGGAPERITAGIFVAGAAASSFAVSAPPLRWLNLETGLLAVDAAMLAGLLILVVRANRLWPIPMAGLQVVQTAGHFLKGLDPHIYPFLYWLTNSLWSYAMIVLLLVATRNHRARLKRLGRDASWNSSSRPSAATDPMASPNA